MHGCILQYLQYFMYVYLYSKTILEYSQILVILIVVQYSLSFSLESKNLYFLEISLENTGCARLACPLYYIATYRI